MDLRYVQGWARPYINPDRGLALFDGIFIETDSLSDPRSDRVLPIFAEEQVLMSRLLCARLDTLREATKRPLRVLDLGTGSGVFAIVAAKRGCEVVAIDRSLRACDFARHNATVNGLPIGVGAGAIDIYQMEVTAATDARDIGGTFDVVILSPPYNPTHPQLSEVVAGHAAAGEIGHAAFEAQVAVVPRLLSENGVCVGNQMTPVTATID